jgi:hypothetical protein
MQPPHSLTLLGQVDLRGKLFKLIISGTVLVRSYMYSLEPL